MSKTTNRFGKPTFTAHATIDANYQSEEVVRQQAQLNRIAKFLFGKEYFSLKGHNRTMIHECINGVSDWSADRLKLVEKGLLKPIIQKKKSATA